MRKCLLSGLTIFLLTATGFSQDQAFKVTVRQVYLPVRIFKSGKAVKNLNEKNFRIWESAKNSDGKVDRVEQKVESFARYDNLSLALAAAIDSSGSMAPSFDSGNVLTADKLEIARNGSKILFKSIFREGHDTGSVWEIFFDEPEHIIELLNGTKVHRVRAKNLHLKQSWTPKLNDIYRSLAQDKKPGGPSPLRDALFELAGCFKDVGGGNVRIIFTLSDNVDSLDPQGTEEETKVNFKTLPEVIAELQNNQILVFAVGLYKRSFNFGFGSDSGDVLEAMAKATGGQAFFETDLSKLPEIFLKIGEMIRDVNFVAYTPKSDLETQRTIEVEVGEWDKDSKWKKMKCNLFYRQGYLYKTKSNKL